MKIDQKSRIKLYLFILIGYFFNVALANSSDRQFLNAISNDRFPVLFVHGRGMKSKVFTYMIKNFIANGYPEFYLRAIDLNPNDGPNIEAAENQIAPYIESFLNDINNILEKKDNRTEKINKIDIVAHSMGAVSTRYYISKLKPERVRFWISTAGPNHGNNKGCPGGRNTGKADLCPAFAKTYQESPVQFLLNGSSEPDVDETPYGLGEDMKGVKKIYTDVDKKIFYITIRTNYDEWLDPIETSILDGAGGIDLSLFKKYPFEETSPGNFLFKGRVGHDEFLVNEPTIKFIIDLLKKGF